VHFLVADDTRILPPSQKTIYSFKLVVGRDINSREIAFPGRESQFPGLDRFRPSTYLRRNSPPHWTPLDNWSSSRAPGGWAYLTAGSGRVSVAVAHVSNRGLGRRRRGEGSWETRSLTLTTRRVRETTGPPSYAGGWHIWCLLWRGCEQWSSLLVQNSSKTTKKFFTFDFSTSIRGLHQKKWSSLFPI